MHERLRILVVDDDPGTAETLGDVLEAKGYEVEIASAGAQALALAEAKPQDVIFLDIKMPQMNGVEVLRRLKAMSPGTLVVMMTAYALPELMAEAERLGALAILAKPLPLDRIIQFLEALAPVKPVLIVQEDATLASSVQEFLRSHGYPATCVADAAQTVGAVRQFRPDVILLDPKVLFCHGHEILQAIREVDPTSTILLMAGEGAELGLLLDEDLRDEARIRLHMPLTPAEVLQQVNGLRIERAACRLRE
jgi:DNA-binding NtrC family response regulator